MERKNEVAKWKEKSEAVKPKEECEAAKLRHSSLAGTRVSVRIRTDLSLRWASAKFRSSLLLRRVSTKFCLGQLRASARFCSHL